MNPTKITTRRLALAAARHALASVGRGHDDPHFECLTEGVVQDCDGLNDRGAGHVCICGCRRCNLTVGDLEVCTCRGCDARACGLHVTTRHALMEENAQ